MASDGPMARFSDASVTRAGTEKPIVEIESSLNWTNGSGLTRSIDVCRQIRLRCLGES